MSLSVGIVGLPNVGKSTLFNALLKKQQAFVANFPFATIEPNVGVVPVPNEKLKRLAEVTKETEGMENLPPEVPATCEFVDIAGLIAGAHKGEGLGNKFLSHIREVDAICHVVRLFTDKDIVKSGSVDPKSDFETVETELKLADFQTLEKQKDPGNTPNKELRLWWEVVTKLKFGLGKGIPARLIELNDEEKVVAKQLSMLTSKPIIIALNCDESDLKNSSEIEEKWAKQFNVQKDQVVAISAKIESELASLTNEEQNQYLKDLGVFESGLERLIKKAFSTLGLITFLTAGEKEVRAWTIKNGINAQKASGVIHTDFEKKFIKADVCSFDDFILFGGWKKARELGKVKSEGKDYVMTDSDVVEFKIGT
ncbi:MAG TPA: redox-regulated ATPase YchF [Candidatus Methanofastidiosum sp.]|nr:redox-regulated ATPase YchF [Methanofastidiosum sp.]